MSTLWDAIDVSAGLSAVELIVSRHQNRGANVSDLWSTPSSGLEAYLKKGSKRLIVHRLARPGWLDLARPGSTFVLQTDGSRGGHTFIVRLALPAG